MGTVAEKNVASAEAYYTAMNNKDAAGIARYLHPPVYDGFIQSPSEEPSLDACAPGA